MHRMKQLMIVLVLTAATWLLSDGLWSVAQGKAVVNLQPSSVVTGNEVTLGDIAQIQGATRPQKDFLSGIVLGSAPLDARRYEMRRSYIIAKMRQNLVNMDLVAVQGPETVEIRSDGIVLTGSRLVEHVRQYVLKETGWDPEDVRFEVSREPKDIFLPQGKLQVDVWKVSGDFYGLTYFRTEIVVDNTSVASVPLVANIHRYVPVLVAAREIHRGSVIREGDVHVRKRNLSQESVRVRRSYCKPEIPVVGMRVKTYLDAGRVLSYDLLVDPPVVELGERVVIETQHGSVFVTAQGEARASAAVGEIIPVRSLLSGKTIMGRVVRPGTVVVE